MKARSFVLLLALAAVAANAWAQETVVEPVTETAFDKTMGTDPVLELFGVAPRVKNILGVYGAKVYGVGLYVNKEAITAALGDREPTKIRIAATIMATHSDKVLVLKFVRDLERKQIADAFREGIEKTIEIDDPRIAEDAQKVLASFTDAKNGDYATMYFTDGATVTISGNDEQLVQVENRILARALMGIYVGPDPVDASLKDKLLEGLPK
jgi:hypothetical protein